jgi:hypothetical protein
MLEGDIREINLVGRLVELWREKFTGAIRFENDGIIKIIYFKGGDILSASTNDRADSVDEILMRAGKVTREHVKQALAKRKENETLGDALLNLGFITRKELTWGRRMQAISVIRSVGQWPAGSFTIVADYLPKREEGTIFPLPQIVIEMIVTEQDRGKFERELDSGSAVFAKMPGFEEAFRGLGLNEDAEAVMRELDGVRSASEVVASSGQEAFNAFKLLSALTTLGLLHRRTAVAAIPPPIADDPFESAGVSDADQAWSMPVAMEHEAPISLPADEPPPPTLEMALPDVTPDPEPPSTRRHLQPQPEFGFDEAQIEAARWATGEAPIPPGEMNRRRGGGGVRPKRSRYGMLIAWMIVLAVGGIAYGAFHWWNTQQVMEPEAPASNGARVSSPAPAPLTVTATTAPTETAAPLPVVETAAPAPQPPPTPTADKAVAPLVPAAKPVAAPSGDLRARYDGMARAYAASPRGNFTVQFEIVCDPANISKALAAGGDKVWFVPITLKGDRACYRVFWGNYETREAAARGAAEIPAALRETTPAVVTVPR